MTLEHPTPKIQQEENVDDHSPWQFQLRHLLMVMAAASTLFATLFAFPDTLASAAAHGTGARPANVPDRGSNLWQGTHESFLHRGSNPRLRSAVHDGNLRCILAAQQYGTVENSLCGLPGTRSNKLASDVDGNMDPRRLLWLACHCRQRHAGTCAGRQMKWCIRGLIRPDLCAASFLVKGV